MVLVVIGLIPDRLVELRTGGDEVMIRILRADELRHLIVPGGDVVPLTVLRRVRELNFVEQFPGED